MAAVKQKKSAMAQWVEAALLHRDISQSELARLLGQRLRIGFDRSKVNKIVTDHREVSAEEMLAIEEITGYPAPAGLRTVAPTDKTSAKVVQVALLDTVAAGKLKAPSSQIPVEDVPLLAFADLGRGDFFALTVEGDSMDRISPDGSVIVVNQADRTLVSGKSYVFSDRGKAAFKVWRPEPPRFVPFSTNPIHEPHYVKSKAEAEKLVIGRVKRTVLDL
ncbi:hypothetical protein LPB73_07385 [Tardiphaga sp. 37S4]|uniref:S24 family peptidase n=1 Tax=Tardiphaga sp. 37S4 TaxID=1404741 RepID=UPI001E5CCEE8|nr:S24 family peptidase [Tardiphaga sp. 37S4]UFS77191.1 hypothetical protein LPB73_07385 [Tardiphaga sp. 37S4]